MRDRPGAEALFLIDQPPVELAAVVLVGNPEIEVGPFGVEVAEQLIEQQIQGAHLATFHCRGDVLRVRHSWAFVDQYAGQQLAIAPAGK